MAFGEANKGGRPRLDNLPSDAERKRKAAALDRLKPYRTPTQAVIDKRNELEEDAGEWLRYYLESHYPLPFGSVHEEIIEACTRAMRDGTSITVAAPRGFGKTRILWGMALYGVLTGLCRFPVVIGWKANAGLELLDQWLTELSQNALLLEAYPCICDPFNDSIASNRLKGILRAIEPEQKAGCDVRKGRGVVILPDAKGEREMKQCALAGASMNGSIKGLNVGLLSGESLRPDIVLMDDPQDEATAESEALIAKVVKKIDYGIRSLSGPKRRLTVMAAVTCVNRGDVAEHLLTREGTEVIKTGQIVTWPKGWEDDENVKKLWEEWNNARLDGLKDKDGGAGAREFYRQHKQELTDGMTVSWEHRYHEADDKREGDPDALFASMWDYFDLGEMAFMAERQNDPVKEGVTLFTLTPDIITAKATDRKAGAVPDWSRLIVAATDINHSFGLTWGIASFASDRTSSVLAYGVHPMHIAGTLPQAEINKQIYEQLVIHGQDLARLPCAPELWIIDASGTPFDAVLQYGVHARRASGINAIPATGRGARQYRPWGNNVVGLPREQCHMASDKMGRKWLAWNADYWREQAQLAWTASVGAMGACSLPAGHHQEFAEQICREQLAGKGEVGGAMVWQWNTLPGNHDYGDVMAMIYAGAAWGGIGSTPQTKRPRKMKRRIKHVEV